MKILLPVDGSACALRAVDQLIQHGAWFCEVPEIHLLYVHPPIPIGRVQAHVGHETLHAYYLEDSREQLVAAAAKLEAAGLAFSSHIHVGQAAEVIVKLADELKVDLLFIGSHGRGSIASALMGSVSSRVLHLAHCPVLVIK